MADTRQHILACARTLYLEQGVAQLSMRAIARRVGISATAIYRHYDHRQQLLAAVVDEGYQTFARYLNRSLAENDPAERLSAAGRAYLDFALEQPQDYSMIFSATTPWPVGELPEPANSRSRATFDFLVERVVQCQQAGLLGPQDPEAIALTIWAHSHGLIALYLAGHFNESQADFRQRWQQSTARLFNGLNAPVQDTAT